MTQDRARHRRDLRRSRGFTLLEALVGIALTGLVLAMLGTVTSRWLPTWNLGFARLQRADLVALVAERVAGDIASAEFVSLEPKSQRATFDGTASSIVLVRSSLGPNAVEGLEIIKIEEKEEGAGFALVRSRAPFALLGPTDGGSAGITFADRIPLLRSPIRVSFAFADATREWRDIWRDMPVLPSAVRIVFTDTSRSETPFATMIATLHMNVAAVCTRTPSAYGCVEELTRKGIVSIPNEARGETR